MRKYIFTLFVAFFAFTGVQLSAGNDLLDRGFDQDRMIVHQNTIYVISSAEALDHVTAYDFHGNVLWDVPFHANIVSWKIVEEKKRETLFVFSKDRLGFKNHLTSVDLSNGHVRWEKP